MKKAIFFILYFLTLFTGQHISAMRENPMYELYEKLKPAQNNPQKLARILQDADPNCVSSAGKSILQHACWLKKPYIVAALLNAKADPNYVDKEDPMTALSYSATRSVDQKENCIPLLIRAKANVNLHHLFPEVEPALYTAIQSRNLPAIKKLIAAGADTSKALEWASESYRELYENSKYWPGSLLFAGEAAEILAFFTESAPQAAEQAGPEENKEEKEKAPSARQEITPDYGGNSIVAKALYKIAKIVKLF